MKGVINKHHKMVNTEIRLIIFFAAKDGEAGLVVLNSFSFGLSVKLLISPSYLHEILAGYGNLVCRFFSSLL